MKLKQKELIQYLSDQHRPITSSELASALNLSSRTIKNYVKEINQMYEETLIQSSRNGYELNRQITITDLWRDKERIPQTYEERAFFIVRELILGHTSHLNIFDLCDSLYISYSTAKSVITQMNKTFSNYNVSFICENDNVYIKGDERSKRKLISFVIGEGASTNYLDLQELSRSFPDINVAQLYELVNHIFKQHGFYINDFARLNLLLHLIIIINRELLGNRLPHVSHYIDQIEENNRSITDEICDSIEEVYNIKLGDLERGEVYVLVRANANYSFPTSDAELLEIVGEEIYELSKFYINQVSNLYMIDLDCETFRTPFALHLNNLRFRSEMRSFTPNPMADTIKNNSPIVFDIAIYITLDLNKKWNTQISLDETAFIAMHIGAEIERQNQNILKIPAILVCPNYRNMEITLANQIMLNFGHELKLINTYHSFDELSELEESINDTFFPIIFSALPIPQGFPLSIIQISPFDIAVQKERINLIIQDNKKRYQNQKLKNYFPIFFESDLFFADCFFTDRDQVLTFISDVLIQKNYVSEDFLSKVYERENASTTAFGNVAIPHCVQMDAIKTSISVALSKKGISWGNHKVHVVLLLSINKADKRNFRYLYESLISIFGDSDFVDKAKYCSSLDEFKQMIYSTISINDDISI